MNVVFRVDSSTAMGVGHVVRCLTLAETLRMRGVDLQFICRQLPGSLLPQVRSAGIGLAALDAPPGSAANVNEDYAAWLGVTQDEDAAQSGNSIAGERPDWLVVDHYGLDAQWEHVLRSKVSRLMAIDDLANRPHDCDLLLDQNFYPGAAARYADLVPPGCHRLLGPRYALLRPEYAQHRLRQRRIVGEIKTVFIFFGGSDPFNLTGISLDALSGSGLRHLLVDVVVGANYAHLARLHAQCADRPGTNIHGPRPHLADLMSNADLAVGAAGTTTWERMCLGIPSIVISTAENQRLSARTLSEAGLIQYLGAAGDVSAAMLAAAIRGALAGKQDLADQSLRGRLAVDGYGAMRTAEFIDPSGREQLVLRPARIEDAELYFAWVNDPEVRRQSVNTADISWPAHQQWFQSKLDSVRSRLFVLEARSLPIGQIRFDLSGREAQIDYSLDSHYRGRGWGRSLIALGVRQMSEGGRIEFRAEVKWSNPASAAVFSRLGFEESASTELDGLRVYRLDSGLASLPEIV